jgi:hypothetical protein
MKNFLAVILFTLIAFPAWGQDSYWRDRQGHPIPNTESRQSERGFGGSVLVTSDADWREKWNTPAETVPEFKEAKSIPRGKHIFVLTFFANPQLSNESSADITCDINIVKPDGSGQSAALRLRTEHGSKKTYRRVRIYLTTTPFTEKCHAAATSSSTALVFMPDLFKPVQYLISNRDEKYVLMCRQVLLSTCGRVIFPEPPTAFKPNEETEIDT